jgi:hypothetical protein
MLSRSSLVRPIAPVAMAAALFVGCNTSLTLDNDTLQQKIEQGLLEQAQVTASVTCPSDRPIKAGDTFQCQAVTDDGTTLTIQVIQKDDSGNVNWQVTGAS